MSNHTSWIFCVFKVSNTQLEFWRLKNSLILASWLAPWSFDISKLRPVEGAPCYWKKHSTDSETPVWTLDGQDPHHPRIETCLRKCSRESGTCSTTVLQLMSKQWCREVGWLGTCQNADMEERSLSTMHSSVESASWIWSQKPHGFNTFKSRQTTTKTTNDRCFFVLTFWHSKRSSKSICEKARAKATDFHSLIQINLNLWFIGVSPSQSFLAQRW